MVNRSLLNQLEHIQQDLFVEFINYKYCHWNVMGLEFKQVHEMFDEATDIILDFLDTTGEYVVSYGACAPAVLSHIVGGYDISTVTLGLRAVVPLLDSALNGALHLKDEFHKLFEVAVKAEEDGVQTYAQDSVKALDKLIFKYRSYLSIGGNEA